MTTPTTVDEYLARLTAPYRNALQTLRQDIRAAAPDATDTISYQMPAFRIYGRVLVSYAAFKDHCSLFPMSMAVIEANKEALQPYLSGKATIRFSVEQPLPTALVERIVHARVAEIAARTKR